MAAPSTPPTYRWNTSDFARGYDAAAEHIHPYYLELQDVLLDEVARHRGGKPRLIVDLGGGSGRLLECLLDRFPAAQGWIIDQSEPFLALAERRLERLGARARCVQARLQSDWPAQLQGRADVIVSMSAIHHLEPAEKRALYAQCYEALASGGLLLNGDEVRPEADADHLRLLTAWSEHMRRGMAGGAIPPIFHDALHKWIDRNVTCFGEPKQSGDDCHETIATQLDYYRAAGFHHADCPWQGDMWAVLRGVKS